MNTLELDLSKRYTYADYLTWWDDVRRELFDGFVHLMCPAPSLKHQFVSGHIYRVIANHLYKKSCKVLMAPSDVRLPKENGEKFDKQIYTVVQPDIFVVCNTSKLDEKGCLGAPDLIIEIVSLKNAKRDVVEKKKLYEKHGVKEYWIVQPHDETVSVFLLDAKGKYQLENMYAGDDKVKVNCLNDFYVDLSEVFVD